MRSDQLRNKLKTSEDIQELERCKALSVLDISYNSLEEPDVLEVLAKMLMMTLIMMMTDVLEVLAKMLMVTLIMMIMDVLEVFTKMLIMILIMMMIDVLEVLAKMPELHVLTSTGNPIIRKTRDYRRNVLHK